MKRAAFTLIEMLLATVLGTILIAAVLTAAAGVARDRRAIHAVERPTATALADLVERDLRNARTMARGPREDAVLVLVGNGALDESTLRPNGRLARVTYRVNGDSLWRQQEYLDDPGRPAAWQECAAVGFAALTLRPPPGDTPAAVPARLRLDVAAAAAADTREVWR